MLRKPVYCSLMLLMLFAVSGYSLFQLSKSSTFQLFGKIAARVATEQKIVALTFDDGPTREGIGPILETLDSFGIQGTFFLVGRAMEEYPEGAFRLLRAGHELGNHSYSHKRMVLKSPRFIREEIENTDRLIRRAGANGEIFFRPPFGKKLVLLPWYLQRNSRVTISWDIAPDSHREISQDHRRIAEYVLSLARPGSIVLLHPWYQVNEETRRALPLIIQGLRSHGYRFVTVSTLLDQANRPGT